MRPAERSDPRLFAYPLDVDEGRLNDDFTGRTWKVQVMDQGEVQDALKKVANEKKAAAAREQENERVARLRAALIKVGPGGGTLSVLRELACLKDPAAKAAMVVLQLRGEVEPYDVTRDNKRSYPGWRATSAIGSVPDESFEADGHESTDADPWSAGHWD